MLWITSCLGHYLRLQRFWMTSWQWELLSVTTMRLCANLFALNFLALILRFFKSFTTNPRLDVVIQTIVDCTPNVAHFFIVYVSLFVSFAFAGHFLFGSKQEGYSSVLASLFTRYRNSMTFEILNEMPVGHQILGYAWVWSYQLLIPSLVLSTSVKRIQKCRMLGFFWMTGLEMSKFWDHVESGHFEKTKRQYDCNANLFVFKVQDIP